MQGKQTEEYNNKTTLSYLIMYYIVFGGGMYYVFVESIFGAPAWRYNGGVLPDIILLTQVTTIGESV